MRGALLLLALLGACGAAPPEPTEHAEVESNHGYGYSYSLLGSDGTRFRNSSLLVVDQVSFNSIIEQAYSETEACTSLNAPGPLIVVDDLSAEENAGGLAAVGAGKTFLDTGLIVVSATAITDPFFYSGDPETGRRPGTSTLRHEFVHYLLRGTLTEEQQMAHQSPLFLSCSGLG